MQTSETTLLFLQFIMRKLRRPEKNNGKPGRAAVVVPNGTLFGDGVCARVKEQLLREFNLHTIVRLPNGVFAPYTSISTNLLFFERSGPTKEIWFYEIPLPEGRKNYTKTMPMQFEEFSECVKWFHPIGKRRENEHAWKVRAEEVIRYDEAGSLVSGNLDIKNPSGKASLEHLPPELLLGDIIAKEQRILEIMDEIRAELSGVKTC
jgi:type I restriction enzyme M protein